MMKYDTTKKLTLSRAIMFSLILSSVLGTTTMAETVEHSLILTDTDISYPVDGGVGNQDYIVHAGEGHPAIEIGNQGKNAYITTTGDVVLNSGAEYAVSPGRTSSGGMEQDARGSVILHGKNIIINGSGIALDYANENGYGNNEKAIYTEIHASEDFMIGTAGDGNTAFNGLFVDTYAGTIQVEAGKGVTVNIEGDSIAGVNESGHITIKAKEDILLNAQSHNADIVMGYIENRNNQYSGYSVNDSFILDGVNGIRNSEVFIQTEGNIHFDVREMSQENLMNVGIFGVGSRKGNNGSPWPFPPASGSDPENEPYLDENGYVASQDNITEIQGKQLDFSVSNIYGIASGILVQGSDRVRVNLHSTDGIAFTVVSEKGAGAIGLDAADGNILLETAEGSAIVRGIAEKENGIGIGIQTENSDRPYTYSNRITLQSGTDNTVYGTSTAVYNTGSDSIVRTIAGSGNNFMLSDKDVSIQAEKQSQTYLMAQQGLNQVQTKNADANAISADTESLVDLQGNNNIMAVGEYAEGLYGNGIAVLASEKAKVTAYAADVNDVQGAVQCEKGATVSLIGSRNQIRSSAAVRDETDEESTKYVISAVYAKDGGIVSITGSAEGDGYQNMVKVSSNAAAPVDPEFIKKWAVWAENGVITINGLSAIQAVDTSAGDKATIGIALVAGASYVAEDPSGTSLTGILNANLADGSRIDGDMLAGNGGQLNIYKGAGSKIMSLAGTGQSIQNAVLHGNVLAGNGGELNLKLGPNTYWAGRADDYQDADSSLWKAGHTEVFAPEFSDAIESSGTINICLDGAEWHVTGQSWVTELNGNGGIVDMRNNISDEGLTSHAVHIGMLNGNHTFVMDLNDNNHNVSDMLYINDVENSSGTQTVFLNSVKGIENMADGDKLRFATVNAGTDKLNFVGQYRGENGCEISNGRLMVRDVGINDMALFIDSEDYDPVQREENGGYNGNTFTAAKPGGAYIDTVYADGTNWFLTRQSKDDELSHAGQTVIDMSKVNYSNAVYMDRLNKRMGEARYLDGDDGLWVRLRHDRIGKDNAFRSMNTMMELGYDWKAKGQKDGEHRQGVVFDYMRGTADYTNVMGDGDVRRAGVWLYDTWLGDKGHYTDYVVKYGHLSNDFDIYAPTTLEEINGDYSNDVWSVSAEYGRKKSIGNEWYIEPQAQMQYAYVTSADYTTSQGTKVELDGIDSLIGRAGFRLGRDTSEGNTVYFKADILHEFLGDQSIRAMDKTGVLSTTYENEGTWYDVGFGFSHRMSKDSYMFLDLEHSFGNDNEDTYQINIGLSKAF